MYVPSTDSLGISISKSTTPESPTPKLLEKISVPTESSRIIDISLPDTAFPLNCTVSPG